MDYDDDLKKSVIDQMMGELDDVTASSLKKPSGPAKGVEISIIVSPKGEEMDADGDEDGDECDVEGCDDPMHNHPADAEEKGPEGSDYISDLLKKMG